MAARSLLVFSQSLRRAQRTIPAFSYPSAVCGSVAQCDCGSLSYTEDGFTSASAHPVESNRTCSNSKPSSFVPNFFSAPGPISVAGAGYAGVSSGRKGLNSATTSGQPIAYSSLAVEWREDETVRQTSEIGYEVLGQYSPEGSRINPQAAFAVVQIGSHQFKVTPGDMIYTEKLKYADINDKLLLNKVLLMGSLKQTIIGRPIVPNTGVLAAVEEIALDAKIIIFKKKRRKNYRRTNGHRQELTRLRILHIEGIDAPTSPETDGVHAVDDRN